MPINIYIYTCINMNVDIYIYIYITDSLGSLPKTAAAELRLCLCFPVTVLEVFGPLGSQGSCYNMLCRSLSELISISVAISVSISMCIYIYMYIC